MRWRVVYGLLVLLVISLSVAAQDADTDGLAIAEQSTQDSFEMTATALVLHATETASVSTRRPTVVVNTPQINSESAQSTETLSTEFDAQQVDGSSTPETDAANDDGAMSPLVATFLMFGMLLVILVIFGAIIIRVRDSSEGNQQQ